jgi:predicted dienelactone hydrolase
MWWSAFAGVPVLFGLLWLDHTRETTLPAPTGPFAVGRTSYAWSDGRILAWIWYPAAPQPASQRPDDYLPAKWRIAIEKQRGQVDNLFLTRDLSRVHAHGIHDAEVSPQQRSYPVVLMRAGFAALVTNYTALAEDLASQGYVVVGFDAPRRSSVVVLPGGTVIERAPENDGDPVSAAQLVRDWSADMSLALDQLERLNTSDFPGRFAGRLDMRRVGVFGHSLGGATALQFCHDDSRCKAAVDLDGAPFGSVIREGVRRPLLIVLAAHTFESEAENRPVLDNLHAIYDREDGNRRWWITIRGANHFEFSDDGALLKSPLVMRVLQWLGITPLDGRRQIAVTAHLVGTFFDVYLTGAPASELKNRANYPEIEVVQ